MGMNQCDSGADSIVWMREESANVIEFVES